MSASNISLNSQPSSLNSARSADSGLRQNAGTLSAAGARPSASRPDCGCRKSSSPAVWNCNFHNRSV